MAQPKAAAQPAMSTVEPAAQAPLDGREAASLPAAAVEVEAALAGAPAEEPAEAEAAGGEGQEGSGLAQVTTGDLALSAPQGMEGEVASLQVGSAGLQPGVAGGQGEGSEGVAMGEGGDMGGVEEGCRVGEEEEEVSEGVTGPLKSGGGNVAGARGSEEEEEGEGEAGVTSSGLGTGREEEALQESKVRENGGSMGPGSVEAEKDTEETATDAAAAANAANTASAVGSDAGVGGDTGVGGDANGAGGASQARVGEVNAVAEGEEANGEKKGEATSSFWLARSCLPLFLQCIHS